MTISRRMQIRRGTTAEWSTRNPVLLAAEPGYEIDTGRLKIGDGAKAWNQLPYYSGDQNTFDITDIEGLADALAGKQPIGSYAAAVHNHDDRYYTETEVTAFLSGKSDTTHTHSAATTTVSGFLSASDKSKLDGIQAGAEVNVNADWNATSGDAQILNKPTIPAAYTLPTASADTLGGVRIGSGISIDANGVITASVGYTLPDATTTTKGGVIVGTGLGVTAGTVSVTYGTAAGTACQGDDSRLSDSRAPTGAAGGDLTGTYPNPTIAPGAVVTADLANSAVTYAKIQNVSATDRLLGRSSAGAGVVEEITCTSAGRALIDDADASAQRTTLGLGTIATQNANSVAITGGSINGTTIGATTASTGAFTTITTTGNVGIGTASPGQRLHVAGSGQGIFIEDTGANRAVLSLTASNTELRIQGTAYVNATQPLTIWTANAERMRITEFGNVGIGTASPNGILHVSSNGTRVRITDTGIVSTATNTLSIFAADQNVFGIGVGSSTATTSHIAINGSTGSVGIGTASPTDRLTVSGNIQLQSTGQVRFFGTEYFIRASDGLEVQSLDHVRILTNGANERVRVTSTGNVGIGTASPAARLHVAGTGAAGYGTELRLTDNAATGNNGDVSISAVRSGVGYHSMTIGPSMDIKFKTGGDSTKMVIDGFGNVGIGTVSPAISSGVGLHIGGSTMRLDTARTPASSTATGNAGEHCWDANYFYVCIATNTWRRVALSSW